MTECVKIKCDDCKFVEDCVDYGWEGCKKFTPKCPLCDGKGKYINGLGVMSVCYYCLGTGEVNDKCERVKTEQEWLQTATTEQLADKLTDFSFWLVPNYQTEDKHEHIRKRIVEWLKEKHNEM